jgi:dihydrodipicolinate synthase/N-acetylneuraminate lyase
MAKLPDNFVKPPPASSRLSAARATPAKVGRRSRKAEDIEAEAVAQVPSVLVRLSPEEHQALSSACHALAAVGQTVSIEDMIKHVIMRWIAATRAMQGLAVPAAPVVPPASLRPTPASIRAQLRRLAAQPLRRWRELGMTLQRWSQAFQISDRG